jgi:hypothetical protein
MRLAGQARYRRSRLNSNVRPRKKTIAMRFLASEPQQKAEDSACAPWPTPSVFRSRFRAAAAVRGSHAFASHHLQRRPCWPEVLLSASAPGHYRAVGARLIGNRQRRAPWRRAASESTAENTGVGAPPAVKLSGSLSVFAGSGPIQVQRNQLEARPNTSVEARPNGTRPGPRSAQVYHAPRGPGLAPLVPPHLER